MNEHLPECHLMQPCGADTPKHGFCSRQQTWCIHCERECICDRLQACEARVTALATPETVAQATYWYEEGVRDALNGAVQRVEALLDPWPMMWLRRIETINAIKGDQP
jgi:hypothetical protein